MLVGSALALLQNSQLDTLVLGDRDQRVHSLSDNKNVGQTSGKLVSLAVLQVDDIVASGVLLTALNDTNTTQVTTTSDHSQVSDIELDEINDLAILEIPLDSVVLADLRVGVADGSSVVGDQVRDALLTSLDLLNASQLEL